MNWLDIVLLILIGLSILSGFKNGLIRGIFSLAGFIVGIIMAERYHTSLAQLIPALPPPVAQVLAWFLIFSAVMVVSALIAWLLKMATSAIMLGWVDRLGGAVFGLVSGSLSCSLLLALWLKFGGPQDAITQSPLSAILLSNLDKVLAILPANLSGIRSFLR